MRNSLVLMLTLLMASPALAEVYKWTDADGRIHFSDKPVRGSAPHRSGTVNAISNPTYNMKKIGAELPYRNEGGSMIVQGRINGVAMRFIVDTGAALMVIPPEIAREAGIATEGVRQITLSTANGRVQAPLINLAKVQIGKLQRSHIRGTVQTVSDTPRTGLLGMSFLDAYRMTVDHSNRTIMLESK